MPTKRRPKKRRSKATRARTPQPKRAKKRSKPIAPKRKAPKKRKSPPKRKPAPKKRASKKRAPKKSSKRSEGAKKGWAKRRKKQRLLDAMSELRARKQQPIGWIERRSSLRAIHGGETWRQISFEFSESEYERERLQILADLEIDFLTKDELYDFLSWMAEEFEIDISDLYRMYLGYRGDEAA